MIELIKQSFMKLSSNSILFFNHLIITFGTTDRSVSHQREHTFIRIALFIDIFKIYAFNCFINFTKLDNTLEEEVFTEMTVVECIVRLHRY